MEYTYKTKQINIPCSINDRHKLIPFGDVHRDTLGCDEGRWEWFLKKSQTATIDNPSTWFLGMGDTHDFGSFGEVKKIHSASLHQTTREKFDMMAQEDNRKFCQEIGFMRGKLLGFIEGNHGWVMRDGKTSTEDLAERMGTESLGWLCHYTLTFDFNDRNEAQVHVYVVACHGKAGGKTAGNSVNQVDWLRNIFPAADIYIMAHDHERWVRPVNVLMPVIAKGGIKLKQKRQLLCRSGSFLKGYHDGTSSYTVAGLFRPSDLGSIQIDISFHRDQSGGEDRIITDIHGIV
jgi:hypothetical protein